MQSIVNQAAEDLDGDGIPELAIPERVRDAGGQEPGAQLDRPQPGRSAAAVEGGEDRSFPTSHHVMWADLDGDRRRELLNAPAHR